jgi:DnaJ-domain-containing protein 1
MRSISRNIELRGHVLQLQSIRHQYDNNPTPAAVPYLLLPQFIPSKSRAPSYLLLDVLVSRANISIPSADAQPFRDCTIPSTATAEAVTPISGSDGLETLIKEFRNSQQPLLQQYGHELKKSHYELLRQRVPLLAQGAAPPNELLLVYRNECSHRKDKIFSEILAALAPSRNEEEINGVAGRWPRITPRSLLRQLAIDQIGELPDQWRYAILHFAVALLRYRHSIRLLELSSGQKREELLRELEAIHNDVLAESTPDWLLIQVCPLFLSCSQGRLRWPR